MNNKNIKVKTFATFNTKTLDEKVNEFTNREDIEVIEIKTSSNWLYISATIIYKQKG